MSRIFSRHWILPICVGLALTALFPAPSRALTPKSPEVLESVKRACNYLAGKTENRSGGRALIGLTFLKADQPDHPKVQEGINAVQHMLQNESRNADVYTVGLMIIFMTELPKEKQAQYASTIKALIDQLKARQKPHGGWGYDYMETGDTSMTQYGVLSLWSAEAAGYETPLDCWEKVANWVMRTQDPGGGFTYQGKDPGGFTPIAQEVNRMNESICSAGAGCLYMCADFFGLLDDRLDKDVGDTVLKKVKKKNVGRKGKETTQVDPTMLWERMTKANQHMDSIYSVYPRWHPYYYLYAYERYKTFKDYSEGNIEKEVEWYTEMAKHLMSIQDADGHWKCFHQDVGDVCDTCFGTLFLLRSMYKKVAEIKRLGAGLLKGGRGLPSGEGDLENHDGTVKRKPLKGPAETLLSMLGDPNDPDFDRALSGLEQQSLSSDDDHLSGIQKKLREMLKNAKTPEQRAALIKVQSRTRDLQSVPVLLEALKDPDGLVFNAANEGLRFMSRKFAGPAFWGGDPDEALRKETINFWNRWYRSLHPDVELEE